METNNHFSLMRLWLLIRRQVITNGYGLLIAFGAIAGMLLLIAVLMVVFNPNAVHNLNGLFFSILFIGGFIYTSNAYAELQQVQRSYSYLTLPVSTTERLGSAWLLGGILLPFFALLAMTGVILLGNVIIALLPGFSFGHLSLQALFSKSSMNALGVYAVTQPIFLLGAAAFRKHHFIKTLLALFVCMVILNAYTGLLGWAMFSGIQENGITIGPDQVPAHLERLFTRHIPLVAEIVFKYVMAPFFLVVTWFRIKERQV